VSDAIEISREALDLLLVRFGGSNEIKPIRRTSESPDGTRHEEWTRWPSKSPDGTWHEEPFPVQRTETMIEVPAPGTFFKSRFLSPCSCTDDGRPVPIVTNVEMRRYAHTMQCKDGRRDANGRRIRSYENSVWAGQCPECGTIHWQEYIPLETSVAE
jgi:hypothetical protein